MLHMYLTRFFFIWKLFGTTGVNGEWVIICEGTVATGVNDEWVAI
jgi:hypothetical protein